MHRLTNIANPFHRDGFFALPHLLIIAIAVLIAYVLGVFTGPSVRSYYATYSRYVVNQPVPPRSPASLLITYAPPVADTGSVDMAYFPPPGDQGSLGQCQCYAFAKQMDYLYNRLTHRNRRYSCLFWYPLATGGLDNGSFFDNYPPILSTVGGLRRRDYDYSGSPRSFAWPLPATWKDVSGVTFNLMERAATHRYTASTEVISAGQNGGDQAIYGIENALAQHLSVNLDLPVYAGSHSFYDSSGIIDSDHTGSFVGGHAISIVKYERNRVINGVRGWFTVSNQWTRFWGLDVNGNPVVNGDGGYALVSYREAASEGFGIEVLHLTSVTPAKPKVTKPPIWDQPSPALHKPIPFKQSGLKPPAPRAPRAIGNWVYGDRAADVCSNGAWAFNCAVPADMGRVVNDAAHANNISAPGLLATLFTECGAYTHSIRCDRYGYGADVSFGRCQVTVQTAAGFGVGGYNTEAVRGYENNFVNCIWLAARVLGSYKRYLASTGCGVDFPNLYVAWNAGPGNPCSFILNPYGQAGGNYYGTCSQCGFLYYWRIALGYSRPYNPYGAPPPPPPHPRPTFSLKRWCAYATAHHTACVSHRWHGKLSWAASVWVGAQHYCGGVVHKDVWYGPGRGNVGFSSTRFTHCKIFQWPKYRTAKVQRARAIP